jgi:hypothetical protein
MNAIDQWLACRVVQARLDRTDNPRHRLMLQTLIDHLDAERDQSLKGLLATLVDEPIYKFWRNGGDDGPKGHEGIKKFYSELVSSRRGVLEYAIERITLDDHTVITDGVISAYQPGRIAQGVGYVIDELDATYLVRSRALISWPFDADGRMIGEEGYTTFDPTSAVRVPRPEMPDVYVDQFPPEERAAAGIEPR